MNKITFILTVSFAIIIISACRGNTAQPAPEPASATETASQPTEVPPTEATATEIPPTEAPVIETPVTEASSSSSAVSYINQVKPILENKCIKCHGIETVKEGLDMRTYESTMTGSFNGAVIIPGDANNSLAIEQIAAGEMPKRGPKVTPEELQLIIDWVNQGAQNN